MSDDWLRLPVAVIERHGRWRHYVFIQDGTEPYAGDRGGWWAFGAGRAERKAFRKLARYMGREPQQRQIIHSANPGLYERTDKP